MPCTGHSQETQFPRMQMHPLMHRSDSGHRPSILIPGFLRVPLYMYHIRIIRQDMLSVCCLRIFSSYISVHSFSPLPKIPFCNRETHASPSNARRGFAQSFASRCPVRSPPSRRRKPPEVHYRKILLQEVRNTGPQEVGSRIPLFEKCKQIHPSSGTG